jgi:hypothetical protein
LHLQRYIHPSHFHQHVRVRPVRCCLLVHGAWCQRLHSQHLATGKADAHSASAHCTETKEHIHTVSVPVAATTIAAQKKLAVASLKTHGNLVAAKLETKVLQEQQATKLTAAQRKAAASASASAARKTRSTATGKEQRARSKKVQQRPPQITGSRQPAAQHTSPAQQQATADKLFYGGNPAARARAFREDTALHRDKA